jgi:hypothetical protein
VEPVERHPRGCRTQYRGGGADQGVVGAGGEVCVGALSGVEGARRCNDMQPVSSCDGQLRTSAPLLLLLLVRVRRSG